MYHNYIVKESDFSSDDPKTMKCSRWIQWATEVGLKPGDKWSAAEYMAWVDAHMDD